MILLNPNEHINCYNYDIASLPLIEMREVEKGQSIKRDIVNHEIVLLLDGDVRYATEGSEFTDKAKGQMLFHTPGSQFTCTALHKATIMVFRPKGVMKLCDNYRVEKLYEETKSIASKPTKLFTSLDINCRIWCFALALKDCIADGLKCRTYFESKITELLIYLRAYYAKDDLHDFLLPILSPDSSFSENVRTLCLEQTYSVDELAAQMNLSSRQFTKRFKRVFDTTPYQWIKKQKVDNIRRDLMTTNKPIKEIAADYSFGSLGQFTNFCKDEMGDAPSFIRKNK